MKSPAARYRARRQAAINAGTWRPRTDGTAAREHLARSAPSTSPVSQATASA
jgi:hypothetical protein